MAHDAFISYSTLDKASADAICAVLEASGIRCWIAPRDVRPGAEWGEEIIDAINGARVMILVFSANANNSPQIRREVERAVAKGLAIIPLRIQNIAPAGSLEYFIGTVHWLDALTPPLETHLRRLAELVKTLLQINPAAPRLVEPVPAPRPRLLARRLALGGLGLVGLAAAAIGLWRHNVEKPPRTSMQSASSAHPAFAPSLPAALPASVSPAAPPAVALPAKPPAQPSEPTMDPAAVGTFEHDDVINGYAARFVYSIATDGTYHLVATEQEDGVFRPAGRGRYRTVAFVTGRVRTGSYRAVSDSAIEIINEAGATVFHPVDPTKKIDPTRPVMLGAWRATLVAGGATWVATIENNSNGTYHFEAQSEDSGNCLFADQQWRTTSTATGRSVVGTYQVVDANTLEITGPSGSAVWSRHGP
jgi:TIR domain